MKRCAAVVFALYLLLLCPADAPGKVIASAGIESSRAHIRFSPEAETLLKAAVNADKNKDWRGAIENYQKALDFYPQYLVSQSALNDSRGAADANDLYWGVRYFCQSALGRLPEAGRKIYNELFGRAARHVFDNAVQAGVDLDKLDQLGGRYALTEPGREALLILLRFYLERGDAYKAFGYYRDLERAHPLYAKELPETGLIAGFAPDNQPEADWPMYAGNNSRSKIMAMRPLESAAYKHVFSWAGYFKLPDYVISLFRRNKNTDIYAPVVSYEFVPYFPIIHKNNVYLPTGSGVYAFEFPEAKDGKLPDELGVKWKVEYETTNRGFPEERTINTASLSADGRRLYAPLISSFEGHERRLSYLDVKYPFPRRLLFCFDTMTAKALWKSDNLPYFNDRANACDDIIFPVAPAEEKGIIYAAGLRMPNQVDIPEHYIFGINARSGVVYFKTFVGSGILETNLFNNPSREPIVSPVTVDGDNIYYCSHIGVMTAVDKYSGAIKWSKKYEEYRIPTTWPAYTPPYLPLRWTNNPIILLDKTSFAEGRGQILAAAVDSPFLYLIEAESGRELWRWNGDESSVGNTRYLLGVKDGLLVISGDSGLICLNLNKAGKLEWAVQDRRFRGKGALAGDKVYIMEDYTLMEVALKTGRLTSINTLQGKEESQLAANLLIAGGFVIRNSIGQMNLYRIESEKEGVNEKTE